jgi:ketosteroid isomerase-like protein
VELTEGSFHLDVHWVLADDEHAVARVAYSASRDGRSVKATAVDVMHLRDGKVVEGWTVHSDQYAFDGIIG